MKTTLITRNIANPQRTTLPDLQDADDMSAETPVDHSLTDVDLAVPIANPRRTVLVDVPQ